VLPDPRIAPSVGSKMWTHAAWAVRTTKGRGAKVFVTFETMCIICSDAMPCSFEARTAWFAN
jgi:hypothetical protein